MRESREGDHTLARKAAPSAVAAARARLEP
jgi:hypothetical protein